jgi:antitoxin HicB
LSRRRRRRRPATSLGTHAREGVDGTLEGCTVVAVKRILARQVERAMQGRGPTKSAMARAMHTSRPALDRLLDPDNPW